LVRSGTYPGAAARTRLRQRATLGERRESGGYARDLRSRVARGHGERPYRAIGYGNASIWTKRVTAIAKRILRFEGTQIVPGDAAAPAEANGLTAVATNIDPAHEAEFNAWYNTEHLPQLAAVPGVLAARRFQAAGDEIERKYLALYHLTDAAVSRSAAWQKARTRRGATKCGRCFATR